MRRLLVTVFFIVLIPFATLIIVCKIIIEETWRAWRSMYLQFRIEMADLPKHWRTIRSL